MIRRMPISLGKHQIATIFLLLSSLFIFNPIYANENHIHVEASQDFAITYHEPLTYKFENNTSIQFNSNPGSIPQKTKDGSEVLIFNAFGRQYKLLLQPNTQLISKLPTKQLAVLNKKMQLFRGVIDGIDDSWVRITREGKKLSGMIWDGTEILVIDESNEILNALPLDPQNQHSYPLIYRLSDTISENQSCAMNHAAKPLNDYSALVEELQDRRQALPQATMELDIAIVADTQFASNNANPDAAVVARMNVVDGIFSQQAGVHLNLSEIRTLTNNAGLTSTSPGVLLDQFSQFSSSSSFTNPGLAHLFTARNLNGSTIGIAYLSSLCSDRFGIGISQVGGNGTAGALTVAHEIGHNFGAPHDNQSGSACASTPQGFIMNPFLDGSDTFSTCSLTQMQPNIQNAACINDIDPTNPTPKADIGIAFPVNPISADVNKAFNYKIELKNSGTIAATNVLAEISLPDELTAESASINGGNCIINTLGNVACNAFNIGSNSTKTINVQLLSSQPGSFTSSVKITADNDSNLNNNQGNVAINVNDISNTHLIDAHFDKNTEGFSYTDDTFRNTAQPAYARGRYRSRRGFRRGGGLQILLGGRNNRNINKMSGGWQQSFTLNQTSRVQLTLRIKLSQSRHYEPDEISEALAAIDNKLISPNKKSYLLRIRGDGNGGKRISTGWRKITIITPKLSAGKHTLSLGGYNNKKTYHNEVTEIVIDDVVLTETANTRRDRLPHNDDSHRADSLLTQ